MDEATGTWARWWCQVLASKPVWDSGDEISVKGKSMAGGQASGVIVRKIMIDGLTPTIDETLARFGWPQTV